MLKGNIIMKKLLFLLLALTFSVALVACNEENYIPTEGLEYNELADGTYEVVGIGSAAALDIVIPAKHNGKSVTSIASNAFNGCYNIKSVIISNGITSIGEGAFNGCTSVSKIILPKTLQSIGTSAFLGCISLNYNEYDNAKYIGSSSNPYLALVYAKNTDITSCRINTNTKFICSDAFYLCSALESIEIPNSVTHIANRAFLGCSSLKTLKLPSQIDRIESESFAGCSSLTSITIPDKVQAIGSHAFEGCAKLNSITLPKGLKTIKYFAFSGCSALTSIHLPIEVSQIESCAFYSCTSLTEIKCEAPAESEGFAADWLENCGATVSYGVK